MSDLLWIPAAIFLPLFPFSLLFNQVMPRIPRAGLRILLLLAWPQIGIALLAAAQAPLPSWIAAWAVATAALYGFRALVVRDLGLWIPFMGTSIWALLWLPATLGPGSALLPLHALGASLPLVVLVLVGVGLEHRFGAAFAGVSRGLVQTYPRLAFIFVMSVLATVATPPAPAFFTLLSGISISTPTAPGIALAVATTWLFWAWAAARLIQGFIVGPAEARPQPDISRATSWLFGAVIAALAAQGLVLSGELL
jgi:hypothetical protein